MGCIDRRRCVLRLVAAGMAVGVGMACGPSDRVDAGPVAAPAGAGSETVHLEVTHRSEWRQLWIEGATDLPDGASINYQVVHELGERAPAAEWPAANLISSGRAAVRDGQYWTRINTFNWPPGGVRIVVQFPLPPQPPEVEGRYGAFGEHLTGGNVIELAGTKVIEVEHTFDHRR